MYAPQLQRCIDSGVDPNKVFLMNTDDLKEDPESVLSEMHKFIGVTDVKYEIDGQDDIQKQMDKKFPKVRYERGTKVLCRGRVKL